MTMRPAIIVQLLACLPGIAVAVRMIRRSSAGGCQLDTYWCHKFAEAGIPLAARSKISAESGQWYYNGQGTGVAMGSIRQPCNANRLFCAGGSTYGHGSGQAAALKEAISNGGRHPQSPLPWTHEPRCSPLPGTDIPRSAERVLNNFTTSGDSVLRKSMEVIARVNYTHGVYDVTDIWVEAGLSIATGYLVNPALSFSVSILGGVFFRGQAESMHATITKLLDHVKVMIEKRFDAFLEGERYRALTGALKNMECATTALTWAPIAESFNIADIFGLPCTEMEYNKEKCTEYQMTEGGNKLTMEVMFTELMVSAWYEAKRNGWDDIERVIQGKVLEAVPLLRSHLTLWMPHRLSSGMIEAGEVKHDWNDDWSGHKYRTCFYTGKDKLKDAYWGSVSSDMPSCKQRKCILHDRRDVNLTQWNVALRNCRLEYIFKIRSEIEDGIQPQIAALEEVVKQVKLHR